MEAKKGYLAKQQTKLKDIKSKENIMNDMSASTSLEPAVVM